jgi:hypothetical protein
MLPYVLVRFLCHGNQTVTRLLRREKYVEREPIIIECVGCIHTTVGPAPGVSTCNAYVTPAAQWRRGKCALASHLQKKEVRDEKKVNPLKQSRRNAKGR